MIHCVPKWDTKQIQPVFNMLCAVVGAGNLYERTVTRIASWKSTFRFEECSTAPSFNTARSLTLAYYSLFQRVVHGTEDKPFLTVDSRTFFDDPSTQASLFDKVLAKLETLPTEWDVFNGAPSFFFHNPQPRIQSVIDRDETTVLASVENCVNMQLLIWNGKKAAEKALAILEAGLVAVDKDAVAPDMKWSQPTAGLKMVTQIPFLVKPSPDYESRVKYEAWEQQLMKTLELSKPLYSLPALSTTKPVVWFLTWGQRLAGCGMPAHAVMIAVCTQLALPDEYECICVTDEKEELTSDRTFGLKTITYHNAMTNPAYNNPIAAMELCWVAPKPLQEFFKSKSVAVARWQAGGTLPDAQLRIVLPFFLEPAFHQDLRVVRKSISPSKDDYSQLCLHNPHYRYQRSFLQTYYGVPADETPYLWSSYFFRKDFKEGPVEIPKDEPRCREDFKTCWREERREFHERAKRLFPKRDSTVFIAEPNSTPNKTCLIPMLIANESRDVLSKAVVVVNPGHQVQPQFVSLKNQMKVPLAIQTRQPVGHLAAEANILVSHQFNCAMNNLMLDTLFLGCHVVHNSDPWSYAGHFYPQNEIQDGEARVREVAGREPVIDLPDSTIDLLWDVSIFNPKNQSECKRLLERLISLRPKPYDPLNKYEDAAVTEVPVAADAAVTKVPAAAAV